MGFIRENLICHPLDAAHALLGSILTWNEVSLRLTELEAYGTQATGPWPDPAAHSFVGPTDRNRAMYGQAGHLYTYLSYGIHICGNIVCADEGVGCGVLIRAGEVVAGEDIARERRGVREKTVRSLTQLASGPGRVGKVLELRLSDNGKDVCPVLEPGSAPQISYSKRIGITKNQDALWRVWITGEPSVSKYRT